MNRLISSALVCLLGLTGAPPAHAASVCDLLQDPTFLSRVSSAGEASLRLTCSGQTGGSEPASPVTVPVSSPGEDRLVNARVTDVYPIISQSETAVDVNDQTLLVGFNDSGQFATTGDLTGVARSNDGGNSWIDLGAPTTPLGVIASVRGDPVIVADRERSLLPPPTGQSSGTQQSNSIAAERRFYFANLAIAAGNAPQAISVHRTRDGGLTWDLASNASPVGGPLAVMDKPWLAVDTRASGAGAGNVYVCWTQFGDAFEQRGIRFSRSTDQGVSFQDKGRISLAVNNSQGCNIAVDSETGVVGMAWLDFEAGLGYPPTIHFARSVNKGSSFQPEITIASAPHGDSGTLGCSGVVGSPSIRRVFADTQAGNASRAIRMHSFPNIAFDPTNDNVYVTWSASDSGGEGADILVARSTDNGQTWSWGRVNLTTNGYQFFPSLAVNILGRIKLVAYSTERDDTDRLIDLIEMTSLDGGLSFGEPVQVSDVNFDRPRTNPQFDPVFSGCYMGDYVDIAAPQPGLGGWSFFSTWGDNRLDGDPGLPVAPDPDVRLDIT